MLTLRQKAGRSPRRLEFLRLGYCDAHRQTVGLPDLLSDEAFSKISKAVREAGRGRLDQRATTLEWVELSRDDLRSLSLRQHRTATVPAELDVDAPAGDADLAF